MSLLRLLLFISAILLVQTVGAQRILDENGNRISPDSLSRSRGIPADSLNAVSSPVRDKKVDSVLKVHSVRKAVIRSAIIPGWGQIYNKKYWKLPLVYGALGITGYIFFDNIQVYRDFRFAYNARASNNADAIDKIKPEYANYSVNDLRYGRDQFRKYIDYSVLFFVVFWGLNVVDASVDAHLKSFDVSPDLSIRIKPGYSELAKTNGVSIVFALK